MSQRYHGLACKRREYCPVNPRCNVTIRGLNCEKTQHGDETNPKVKINTREVRCILVAIKISKDP